MRDILLSGCVLKDMTLVRLLNVSQRKGHFPSTCTAHGNELTASLTMSSRGRTILISVWLRRGDLSFLDNECPATQRTFSFPPHLRSLLNVQQQQGHSPFPHAYSRIRDLHVPSMSHTRKDIPIPHNQGRKTHHLLSMYSKTRIIISTSPSSTRISVLTSLYFPQKISNIPMPNLNSKTKTIQTPR